MEETFKESVIEKIGQIEKEISALSKNAATMDEIRQLQKGLTEDMAELKAAIPPLNKSTNTVYTGLNLIKDLTEKLKHHTRLLENPVEKKEHHIHHFRWPLGVAVGIFLLLILAVSALYINHRRMQQYIANDTKYLSLQLVKDNDLQHYLYLSDSLYQADPGMRKQVLEKETAHKRKQELLQEAREKQQEATDLQRKAEKSGR